MKSVSLNKDYSGRIITLRATATNQAKPAKPIPLLKERFGIDIARRTIAKYRLRLEQKE